MNATYDFTTTDEARKAIEGIVTDMSTKEGQREAEHLFSIARIEERDAEPSDLMCQTCRGKGQYAGLDITCRSCHGSGIEPQVTLQRIEDRLKQLFQASEIGSWEWSHYFDGLLEVLLLKAGYPTEKQVPREKKAA